MQFHINLRVMAKFKKNLNPFEGTVYTLQIQEFLKKGFTIASSNFHDSYNIVKSLLSNDANNSFDTEDDIMKNLPLNYDFNADLPKDMLELLTYISKY